MTGIEVIVFTLGILGGLLLAKVWRDVRRPQSQPTGPRVPERLRTTACGAPFQLWVGEYVEVAITCADTNPDGITTFHGRST